LPYTQAVYDKNMLNKNLILLLFVLIFSVFIFADVPPARNEIRTDIDLAFTPRDDFADYRFFLAYGGGLNEIEVKKDVPVILEGSKHGGQLRYSSLIAIAKVDLEGIDKISDEQEQKIVVSVIKRDNKGYIELIKHTFQEDIPIGERVNKIYPVYELKREGNLPKLFEGQGISKKLNDEEEEIVKFAKYEKATIIAGILLTLAVLLGGVYLFRRSRKS
jgi:hypothetical protein